METIVYLGDLKLAVRQFQEKQIDGKREIAFVFDVTSAEYHDVTTKLYENNFQVHVPEKNLRFNATISNYATSTTNLYKEGAVSEFKLKLIAI